MLLAIGRLAGRVFLSGTRALWSGKLGAKAGVIAALAALVVLTQGAAPVVAQLVGVLLPLAFLLMVFGLMVRGR